MWNYHHTVWDSFALTGLLPFSLKYLWQDMSLSIALVLIWLSQNAWKYLFFLCSQQNIDCIFLFILQWNTCYWINCILNWWKLQFRVMCSVRLGVSLENIMNVLRFLARKRGWKERINQNDWLNCFTWLVKPCSSHVITECHASSVDRKQAVHCRHNFRGFKNTQSISQPPCFHHLQVSRTTNCKIISRDYKNDLLASTNTFSIQGVIQAL